MARILITGGSGRIGTGVLKRLHEIISPYDEIHLLQHINPLKIIVPNPLVKVVPTVLGKYDIALHLAAQADTNFCKKPGNREAVLDANMRLTERICRNSAFVLLVSTDNVFDGNSQPEYTENDATSPCNLYGESKVLAEQIVMYTRGAVVRLSAMLGVKNRIVDEGAIQYIQGHDHFPFWNNTFVRPSFLDDFIKAAKIIIETRRPGIFHCTCNGRPFSRAEMAKIALKFFHDHGLATTRETIPEEECPAVFPHRYVLSTDRTRRALGLDFTDSEKALEKHLEATLL